MPAFLLAIFLSAFLLFQIQPIIARSILPWYGGGPTIWTTCMLFFQAALLLGYLYAHIVANSVPSKRQAVLHVGLLLLSLLAMPIGVPDSWVPTATSQPAFEILLLLAVSVGVPFILVSASGPLLQHWFAGVFPDKSPFRLYALSNIGSLAALLTYPVLVEPTFTISGQANSWSLLYAVLLAFFAACGYQFFKSNSIQAADTQPAEDAKPVSLADKVLWVSLAACGSAMLLAITNQISTNVAVVPFLWILPLSIYLITFIICFDKDSWYVRRLWFALLSVATVLLLRLMLREYTSPDTLGYQLFVYSLALFACCMVCHGELVRRRSAVPHLTTFYLYVALGGAVGGLFVNVFAPLVFTGYWELHVSLAATILLAGICLGIDRNVIKTRKRRIQLASVWAVGMLAIAFLLVMQVRHGRIDSIYVDRSFFGTLFVDEYDVGTHHHQREFYHGSIQHGLQLMHPVAQKIPTAYYGRDTGVSAAILYHPTRLASRPGEGGFNIGAVGLGVGTISTYGRRGDSITFYEINPYVEQVAHDYFTYLKNSYADIDVVLGDARVSLQRELEIGGSRQFDVLVLDAFSGDAIPVHLLTDEAFDLYEQHLKDDGVLAVHISNAYIDLQPLIRTAAQRLGKEAIYIEKHDENWYERGNEWVLLSTNNAFLNSGAVQALRSEWGSRKYSPVTWTDDFSNLLELVNWSR